MKKKDPVREVANTVLEATSIYSLKQPNFGRKQIKSLKRLKIGHFYQIIFNGKTQVNLFVLLWEPEEDAFGELCLRGLRLNDFSKRYSPATLTCASVGLVPLKRNGFWVKNGGLLRTGKKVGKAKVAKLRKLKF